MKTNNYVSLCALVLGSFCLVSCSALDFVNSYSSDYEIHPGDFGILDKQQGNDVAPESGASGASSSSVAPSSSADHVKAAEPVPNQKAEKVDASRAAGTESEDVRHVHFAEGNFYTTDNNVPLFLKSSGKKKLRTLPANTLCRLRILDGGSGYSQVELQDGLLGYVASKQLSNAPFNLIPDKPASFGQKPIDLNNRLVD